VLFSYFVLPWIVRAQLADPDEHAEHAERIVVETPEVMVTVQNGS
jgi:hypothetical protein